VLQYLEENKMRMESFFQPFSEKYVEFCEGDEFMIHLNLEALLIEENVFSRELKDVWQQQQTRSVGPYRSSCGTYGSSCVRTALRMTNHYLEQFL
jgi:hypothetical protein